MKTVEYLGHKIGNREVGVAEAKTKAICKKIHRC